MHDVVNTKFHLFVFFDVVGRDLVREVRQSMSGEVLHRVVEARHCRRWLIQTFDHALDMGPDFAGD